MASSICSSEPSIITTGLQAHSLAIALARRQLGLSLAISTFERWPWLVWHRLANSACVMSLFGGLAKNSPFFRKKYFMDLTNKTD